MDLPDARPPARRRALLIVNEHSRSGRERGDEAEAALDEAGLAVTRGHTDSREDVSRRIREMRGSVDLVVVGGGDGTINAAAPGIIGTGLPLGVLPLGTANDLARTLGLPMDLEGAVAAIAAGHLRRIDLGEVNGHPYFNVASLGFGVDLTHALTSDAKKRWGPLGYAVAGLRVLRRLRPFHVDIEIGGVRHPSRTVHLAVGNGRHYGGGMTVSHDAAIDDGRLDVYSLEVASVWKLLMLLPALRSGHTQDWTEIHTLDGAEIRVTAHRERSVNADGEIVTRTPAVFRVLHDAVAVFAPG
ncbi:lipid kinase [Lichenibacterium minor]|uniref:Lipid kinase n=1 Tax=Lichenibacterium minor TaxID=2316528 RepID=A0A4Q2UAI9_9HYPH|nr:lipid kinase [Lichenibacterium minor]RYC31905.1 lipid kinase [Lichenibacterium minor]